MTMLQKLKSRWLAILMLAAFAIAMLAPVGEAEASSRGAGWPTSGPTQRVSWNSGPQ